MGFKLKTIGNQRKTPYMQELEMHLGKPLEKGAGICVHLLLKEIYEQPGSILDSMRGQIGVSQSKVALKVESQSYEERVGLSEKSTCCQLVEASWHAGLVGEYLIERNS